MAIVATASPPTTCSARVGFWPGEYGEMPAFCSTSIGLVRYTDIHGMPRAFCRHHGALVRHRYPVAPEAADDRCFLCKRSVDDGLYTRVRFGAGVVNLCDICREKGDES